jgi:hypothetical protein
MNLVSYLSLGFGIAGFAAAIYFGLDARRKPLPRIHLSPLFVIAEASLSVLTDFELLYRGEPLHGAVSAGFIYFWNAGRAPIKAGEILEPLRIQLSPQTQILSVRLLRVSREVTKFAIGEVTRESNEIPISFHILEPDDGAALQIIFRGRKTAVDVKGAIVGVPNFSYLENLNTYSSIADGRWFPFTIGIGLGLMYSVAGLVFGRKMATLYPHLNGRAITAIIVLVGIYCTALITMFFIRRKVSLSSVPDSLYGERPRHHVPNQE